MGKARSLPYPSFGQDLTLTLDHKRAFSLAACCPYTLSPLFFPATMPP